jgi:nucleoside-diphosphate-sugar epimerase
LARVLIVGCGCRGRALARVLSERRHAVRGTTRSSDGAPTLEAVGIEAFVGDPDRVATLAAALEHVSVACLLLGSATGQPSAVQALHGTRLEMLLTRMIDTTVRGIVYESAGSVDGGVLAGGAARVRTACEDSLIPYALIDRPPEPFGAWLEAAAGAVERVLG